MYELYSQQRPGKPRWTIGASAVVLLITVAMAAAVTRYKSQAILSQLTSPQVFQQGRIKVSLPEGWKLAAEKELTGGAVARCLEPTAKNTATGRQLVVFRHL